MPEGHTIHRVARDHNRRFAGRQLQTSSPQGRFQFGAKKLDGRVLERVEAYGKHLFYWWEGDEVVHVHLGLYGKFRNHRSPPPEPRGAVRWRVTGDEYTFDLNGPTACEVINPSQRDRIVARLGQDPLRRDADPDKAWNKISRSKSAIGKLLLDQSVIAGVGNVYRAEVLHAYGVNPDRPGKDVSREEFDGIWSTLVTWLKIGVKYNRIITADPESAGKSLGRLKRDERLLIYKRVACPSCDAEVATWNCGARTIYACRMCQT